MTKKNVFRTIVLLALAVLLSIGFMACKQKVVVKEAPKDTTAPAEVKNLKTVAGDSKVSLTWTNSSDDDLHQIMLSAEPAEGTLKNPIYLSADAGNSGAFTVEGLSNGVEYTFKIKAIDKALNKSSGVSVKARPKDTSDKTPPAEVKNLLTTNGNSKVALSWKNPHDSDLYQIRISAEPAEGTLKNPVYLSAQSDLDGGFMVEGLRNGVEYTFSIVSIDKSLNKSTVQIKKSTPQDNSDKTPPKQVTNLQSVAGNSKVSLTWTNSSDSDLYQVEITANPAEGTLKNPVYLNAESGKSGAFTVEGLSNATEYTFTVKAIDKTLNKNSGVSKKATPQGTNDTTAPVEVGNLQTVAGDSKVSLSWTNPSDVDLYQVEITATPAEGSLTNPVCLNVSANTSRFFTVTGLTNGKAYTFIIKSVDKVLNKSVGVTETVGENILGGVFLEKKKIQLALNASKTLSAKLDSGTYTNADFNWVSNRPDIVEVDENGQITGKQLGSALITVSTKDGTKNTQCIVKVKKYISVRYSNLENWLRNEASNTELNYIEVTEIPEEALYGKNDRSSSIGSIIRKSCKKVSLKLDLSAISSPIIPDGAFFNCFNLEGIVIPSGVTKIGTSSFRHCDNLENIIFPDGFVSIGEKAFSYCSNLKNIDLPDGVKKIEAGAFSNCCNLENINFADSIDSIAEEVFADCSSLKNITLPNSLKTFPASLFSNCINLENIVLPDSLDEIDGSMFPGCSKLKSFSISELSSKYSTLDGVLFDKTKKTLILYPKGLEMNNYDVREGVTEIYKFAFFNCVYLQSVSLPTGCSDIGSHAFRNCTNLESISFPKSLTSIADNVFENCTSLENISLSAIRGSIGSAAFKNCTNLKEVHIPANMTSIERYTFYNCTSLEYVSYSHPEKIGFCAFKNCTSLKSLSIGSDLEDLEKEAFYNCTSLKTIVYSGNIGDITDIPARAFYNCSSLEEFEADNIRNVHDHAFYNCKKLNITLNKDLESIGTYAFYGCTEAVLKFYKIIPMEIYAFGKDEDSWCKRIFVPYYNENAKWAVRNTRYPMSRIHGHFD